MSVQKAYKVEIDPTNKQRTLLAKHAGTARFTWNWALARVKDQVNKPNAMELHKALNARKQEDFPWMYEVSKCAPQEALRDLQQAFKNFFKNPKHFRCPKRKKRGLKNSFRLNGSIQAEGKRIRLPRLGWLKLKEHSYIPENHHILSATVSKYVDRWYVSVLVKEDVKPLEHTAGTLGVDLGIKHRAVCSDGTVFNAPKALRQLEGKIEQNQRRRNRRERGGGRWFKAKIRVAKLWRRVRSIRQDFTHKMTSWIVKTKRPAVIVLENLNIAGMLKNHRISKSLSDACLHEVRRQIEYKAAWYGIAVGFADRFFPSTQLCSQCGERQCISLSQRTYNCENCGLVMDRDLNASINLRNTGSSPEIYAQGDKKLQFGLRPFSACPRTENSTGSHRFL